MDNRTEVMQFRVTPREKALIEKCAKKEGAPVSNYIRGCMLMEMIIDGEAEALKIVMETLGRNALETLKRRLQYAERTTEKA